MYCKKCGSEIPEGSKFCTNCGTAVDGNIQNSFDKVEREFQSGIDDVKSTFSENGSNNGRSKTPLKTDRGIWGYILLHMITCGIYSYFFIYNLAKDVNTTCEGDGENTAGLGMYVLLSIVTCGIYNYIWMYKIGNRLASNAYRYGLQFQENGTTILLWYIFGIILCGVGPFIGMNILMKNTNAICAAYNRKNGFC